MTPQDYASFFGINLRKPYPLMGHFATKDEDSFLISGPDMREIPLDCLTKYRPPIIHNRFAERLLKAHNSGMKLPEAYEQAVLTYYLERLAR